MSWTYFPQYIVSQNDEDGSVVRACPFCAEKIKDENGEHINFLVHLGSWKAEHQKRQEWADYIQRINTRLP